MAIIMMLVMIVVKMDDHGGLMIIVMAITIMMNDDDVDDFGDSGDDGREDVKQESWWPASKSVHWAREDAEAAHLKMEHEGFLSLLYLSMP